MMFLVYDFPDFGVSTIGLDKHYFAASTEEW